MVIQHFWPQPLSPGRYLIGVQTKDAQQVDLAELELFPAQEQASHGGAWHLTFCTNGKLRNFLRYVSSRLGLHPVRFTKKFVQALRDNRSVGLIADTNALYSGALAQALPLRLNKPTYLGIPDQVFMEMQKLREHSPSLSESRADQNLSVAERWHKEQGIRKHKVVLPRVMQRLQASGYLIHRIEPADAKVRYFGGNRGSIDGNEIRVDDDESGETVVGSDLVRDRLVLEAVRAARANLDGLQIWLVTSDKHFAHQARIENFLVGYAEPLPVSQEVSISSPWINPYTLGIEHLPIEHFLEEILYLCETVTLQAENRVQRQLIFLTTNTHSTRIWMDLGEDSFCPQVGVNNKNVPRWPASGTVSASSETTTISPAVQEPLILTAPISSAANGGKPGRKLGLDVATADLLVSALVRSAANGVTVTKKTPDARQLLSVCSYLVGIGWVDEQRPGKDRRRYVATSKGQAFAQRWVKLRPDLVEDIPAWAACLKDVAEAISIHTPHAKLISALPANGGATYDSLAEKLKCNESTIRKQVALGQYLGTVIRVLSNKEIRVWRSTSTTAVQAAAWMLEYLKDGIRIDRLFLNLLETHPLALPTFRLGLLELLRQGQVRFGGSLPDTTRSDGRAVRVGLLVPSPTGAESRELDLGAGDFLIPGQPCQAMLPMETR